MALLASVGRGGRPCPYPQEEGVVVSTYPLTETGHLQRPVTPAGRALLKALAALLTRPLLHLLRAVSVVFELYWGWGGIKRQRESNYPEETNIYHPTSSFIGGWSLVWEKWE